MLIDNVVYHYILGKTHLFLFVNATPVSPAKCRFFDNGNAHLFCRYLFDSYALLI